MRNLTLAAMAALSLGLAACVPEQPPAVDPVPTEVQDPETCEKRENGECI